MRIAVASNGLDVASHFSQCANFNYYTTKSCEIVDSQNMPSQGYSSDECAEMMRNIDVNVLICNKIAPAAKASFSNEDILVIEGAEGNALQAAQALLEGAWENIYSCDEDLDD